MQLRKELQAKQNIIDEKDEELFELNEAVTKKVCLFAYQQRLKRLVQ